jgi:hypothetical protein
MDTLAEAITKQARYIALNIVFNGNKPADEASKIFEEMTREPLTYQEVNNLYAHYGISRTNVYKFETTVTIQTTLLALEATAKDAIRALIKEQRANIDKPKTPTPLNQTFSIWSHPHPQSTEGVKLLGSGIPATSFREACVKIFGSSTEFDETALTLSGNQLKSTHAGA